MTRPGRVPQPIGKRLLTKFTIGDECWEWTGRRDSKGYGSFDATARKKTQAHRAVYEWLVGPIPDGLEIDHLCRVRHCVNPGHLEPVTHQENCRRAAQYPEWHRPKKREPSTHCGNGHALTPDNTWGVAKRCRTCALADKARAREKRKKYGAITPYARASGAEDLTDEMERP